MENSTKKKKIIFISAANNIHTVRWVNALSNKYDIHLVTCKNHSEIFNKIKSEVKIHILKYNTPWGYYLNARQLKRIYNEVKPDLINVHYASGYGTLARMARIQPILLSVWGSDIYDFPKKSKINYKILEKNLKNSSAIASTSIKMKEELERLYPNIEKKIYITPFGVDINKFKKINKERNDNEFRIGIVKTLKKKYGISDLILAFNQLKKNLVSEAKNNINVKLYIYGDGEQKQELLNLIEKLNLNDDVFLKGKIKNEQVPEVLNDLDLFCATSILDSESFGVAVVEAMACELPIIATDVDGFKEVLINGKTGVIVKRQDITAIATAMEDLILNKEKRAEYGINARKRVLEKYSWDKNVEYMMSVYEEVMKDFKKGEQK